MSRIPLGLMRHGHATAVLDGSVWSNAANVNALITGKNRCVNLDFPENASIVKTWNALITGFLRNLLISMPERFRVSVRPWIYRYLCLRDGERCFICGKDPTCLRVKKGTSKLFDIDHIDGNKKNNDDSNLRLLCRSCNVRESNKVRSRSFKGVCVSKTEVVKALVRYHNGSAEMSVSGYCEPDFRRWVSEIIEKDGFISKDDAINGGAEQCGCSVATASRYLQKMTSIAGNYKEETDRTGMSVIVER